MSTEPKPLQMPWTLTVNASLPESGEWRAMRQLAAERERADKATALSLTRMNEASELRDQLAAEREKYAAQREDWIAEIQQLQEKVQTLVDALTKSREYIWDSGYFDAKSPLIRVIDAALAKVEK